MMEKLKQIKPLPLFKGWSKLTWAVAILIPLGMAITNPNLHGPAGFIGGFFGPFLVWTLVIEVVYRSIPQLASSKEKPLPSQSDKSKFELIVIAIVLFVVFAGVFFFLSNKSASGDTLVENSLLVKSSDPVGDIQKRIPEKRVLIEQRLFEGNSSKNSFITIMSSEIARGLSLRALNVTVYAIVEGGENVCFGTDCTGASIIVQVGACNCVYFDPTHIIVEGDEKFLSDQSVRAGRLMGFAVFKKTG